MVAKVAESTVHEWLIDSGAFKSLVNRNELPTKEVNAIYKLQKPLLMQSANGAISADDAVKIRINGEREPTECIVLDNTCLLYTSPSPRDQRGSGYAWSW